MVVFGINERKIKVNHERGMKKKKGCEDIVKEDEEGKQLKDEIEEIVTI